MRRKFVITIVIIIALVTALLFYYLNRTQTKQSLVSFPEDQSLSFTRANTSLMAKKGNQNQLFSVNWKVSSATNKSTYLRQDISLLYEDGRLISVLNKWKNNTQALKQMKTIDASDSGHFEAITVHHAEAHYPNDVIKAKIKLTYDHLYIMASPLSHLTSFKIPMTTLEKEWYQVLDKTTHQQLHYILEQAYYKYKINPANYYIFPMSYLHVYNENCLPGLSSQETHRVISNLWEGLYNNYVMGIKTNQGNVISPLGSSIPYILFSKKGSHLLIVTQASSGEIILLKQMF